MDEGRDMVIVPHFIDGKLVEDTTSIRRISPVDPKIRYLIARGRDSAVESAVSAARRAKEGWVRRTVRERASMLAACADWLVERYGEAGEATDLKSKKL